MKKYVNIIDLREVDSFDMYFVLGAKPLTEDVSVLSVAYRDGAGDIVSLSKEDIDMMNPHSAKEEFDLARLYFSAYCQENGLILVEDNFTIEYNKFDDVYKAAEKGSYKHDYSDNDSSTLGIIGGIFSFLINNVSHETNKFNQNPSSVVSHETNNII